MQRRSVLRWGWAGAALLAVAGGGVAMWQPGWREGRLSPQARSLLAAVAGVVLEGCLPQAPAARAAAVQAHLARLEASLRGLAPSARAQLSQLLALLGTAPGRLALTGSAADWAEVDPGQLAAMLQALRTASSQTRQQVYHGLRDLTCAAYFADPATWALIGYPGPQPV